MNEPARPKPRLTAVTLGVRDFNASLRFYEALGFARRLRSTGDEIAFLDAGGVVLALYRWDQLAKDAALESPASPGGVPRNHLGVELRVAR
jgi:catechol 2,3-dioxygenase-like lactoylglutathione lyase family enzyme